MDEGLGEVGLLLSFGEDEGDGFAVPVDAVVLHDGEVGGAAGFWAGVEDGRGLEPGRVAVGEDE